MAVIKIPDTYLKDNACFLPINTIGKKINEVIDAIEGGTGSDIVANTLTSNTTLIVGTDEIFSKEVNHNISVDTSTTAATAGGNLTISSGIGATSGNGGALNIIAAASGNTAGSAGGNILVQSGATGATSGLSGTVIIQSAGSSGTGTSGNTTLRTGASVSANSGSVSVTTGQVSTLGNTGNINLITGDSATSGNTGSITIRSGTAISGIAGNISIIPGNSSSTSIVSSIILNKSVLNIPSNASVASGATITTVQLLNGHITATGATGNWTLPDTADIIIALGGGVNVGTNFEFIFNAKSMTATNTATLVVGANMSVMSAPAITGGGSLTITQNTQVVGLFRVIFDSTTTCKISRIS